MKLFDQKEHVDKSIMTHDWLPINLLIYLMHINKQLLTVLCYNKLRLINKTVNTEHTISYENLDHDIIVAT